MTAKRVLAVSLVAATLCARAPAAAPQTPADPRLRPVQEQLDQGDADKALELLAQVMKKAKPSAEALLLRSTALIMSGDTASGFTDLERALKIDPALRQGWLNLAGLEIAEGHYDAAYDALLKAQELDPDDPDNHLNLGAVMVLQGKADDASAHFDRYLAAHPDSAESYYLVASNYALGGYEGEAVENLRRAVKLDERMRIRARSDDRFLGLESEEYHKLLTTDVYQPPPGAYTAAAAFEKPYRRREPDLVYAVLDALKAESIEYDPTVEANDDWALIWTPRMRIKLFTQSNGTGVVKLFAAAEGFTTDQWQERSQTLFRTIYEKLRDPSSLR